MIGRRIIQVEEKVPVNMLVPLSIQHMFAMFGASVLVPFIFGINPAVVLFMNGVGTLLFILVIKLCVSCSGGNRYRTVWLSLCAGRICGRGFLRLSFSFCCVQIRHKMD